MENQKRASRAAVICYGFGDLASQFVWTFVGSYLTLFYTDVVGLAPAIVSVIMMGARIWDGVNDPMMGAIAERTRSRFGRFRPYIAFGCPFLALFGVLTFTNPFGGSSVAGIIVSQSAVGAVIMWELRRWGATNPEQWDTKCAALPSVCCVCSDTETTRRHGGRQSIWLPS